MQENDHVIDLGNELIVKVKYAGSEYSLREPSVAEIDAFRSKDADKDGAAVLIAFLTELGMPNEVVKKMGMSKAKQLVDGLMEFLTKKK